MNHLYTYIHPLFFTSHIGHYRVLSRISCAIQFFLINYLFYVYSEVTQSNPTLCNPMDYSLPGSSVHGIFQARVLEWVAISFSRGSSQPRDRSGFPELQADALPSEPPGKPILCIAVCICLHLPSGNHKFAFLFCNSVSFFCLLLFLPILYLFIYFPFIFISWRLITIL